MPKSNRQTPISKRYASFLDRRECNGPRTRRWAKRSSARAERISARLALRTTFAVSR